MEKKFFITFNGQVTYMMYDSFQLLKNLTNNLLSNKFIFTPFGFFHKIPEEEEGNLLANLQKSQKLGEKTYPGNNKQDVSLTLNIFLGLHVFYYLIFVYHLF